jgi:hypothetical protein
MIKPDIHFIDTDNEEDTFLFEPEEEYDDDEED